MRLQLDGQSKPLFAARVVRLWFKTINLLRVESQ